MSDFATTLLKYTGEAGDSFDIRAVVRRCFFYDFDGYPLRLWAGQGVLTTTTGVGDAVVTDAGTLAANEWLGTVGPDGTDYHVVPAFRDSRDGSSPRYTFKIPSVSEEFYSAIKADADLAIDREMRAYMTIIEIGEGLIPQTPIRFEAAFTMRDVKFSERLEGLPGQASRVRSVAVLARSREEGRSLAPRGTYSDTSQRERARLLGVESDSGCVYVASNASRTFLVGG